MSRITYTKRQRHEPHAERPRHRKKVHLVRRWVAHKRDSGEEPSSSRVWRHVRETWPALGFDDWLEIYTEAGYNDLVPAEH